MAYYRDRLGFRFVLRQANASAWAANDVGTLQFDGQIQNVGWGQLFNKKAVNVILKSPSTGFVSNAVLTDIDPYGWQPAAVGPVSSPAISGASYGAMPDSTVTDTAAWHDFSFAIPMSAFGVLPVGNYNIYLKINDPAEQSANKRSIEFANNGVNIWDTTLGANLIGSTNVVLASQTITVSVPAPPTATNKSSFTVGASASSGLPITFSSAGHCFNNGATYTIDSATGTCTVTMNQAGNSSYAAAPTVTESIAIAAAIAPTVSVTVPATAQYQSTYTVVATTNASTTPTLTAAPATTCTISGDTVTMIKGTGTCTVTAKWAADNVYKAATATGKTTAEVAASVVIWATPDPITYGTALSANQLDATANVPGKFVYTPTSGKVLAAGTQALSVKFTPTQTADYTTVTGTTVALVVNPANTTTNITSTTPNPSSVGRLVTINFSVVPGKPTGSVTVSASSGETCSATLTAGRGYCKLGLGTAGSITLTATYGGDANNTGSVSAGFTQTVN